MTMMTFLFLWGKGSSPPLLARKSRPSYIEIKFLVNVFQPTDSGQVLKKLITNRRVMLNLGLVKIRLASASP